MPAAWAVWVIEAVEKWVTLQGDEPAPDGWRCAGRAAPAREQGWLVLDTREHPLEPDTLIDLCLADEPGPEAGLAHLVGEFRIAHGVVLLREPSGLPRHSRYVWVRSTSRPNLLDALRKGLRAVESAPLAEALAAGALAGSSDASVPVPAGMVGAQAEAYRACHTPGVRLVWGAAGTGKTHVLAHAVRDLVAAGRRVLLLSTADAAVDALLRAALPGLPAEPGTAVRVGPAHLAEVAGDSRVQLDALARRASA
ncbi:AAA family ATPase, partial [Pseudonocardia aurantiaca]